jgi:hypothetical protein
MMEITIRRTPQDSVREETSGNRIWSGYDFVEKIIYLAHICVMKVRIAFGTLITLGVSQLGISEHIKFGLP